MTEGAGIFIGIVAWDVLSVGQLDLVKALLISAASTLVWYGVRCWRTAANRRKRD